MWTKGAVKPFIRLRSPCVKTDSVRQLTDMRYRAAARHSSLAALCWVPDTLTAGAGGGWMGSLLGQGKITGEVERMFVTFRILRKRALRYYIEKLARQLQGDKAEL